MNREIKFKVWDLYRCKMKNLKTISFEFTNTKDSLITANSDNGEVTDIGSRFILMQYTGKKDKNGKEIYEGDIIEKHFEKYEVLFHNCEWVFTKLKDYYKEQFYKLNFFDDENFEIVGNIYENPEFTQSSE